MASFSQPTEPCGHEGPIPEPAPAPQTFEESVSLAFMNSQLRFHEVASSISAVTLKGVPETVADMTRMGLEIRTWLKEIVVRVEGQHKAPFQGLIGVLDQLERSNMTFVMCTSDVSHLLYDLLRTMESAFQKVKANYWPETLQGVDLEDAVQLDMYTPALLETDLKRVDKLAEDIGAALAELRKVASTDCCIGAIQAASKEILSSDCMRETMVIVEESEALLSKIKKLKLKHAEEEAHIAMQRAVVEDVEAKAVHHDQLLKSLKARHDKLVEQKTQFQDAVCANRELAKKAFEDLKAYRQKQCDEVQKQKMAAIQHDKTRMEKVAEENQKKAREIEMELVDLEITATNHIVFVVDQSASMSGDRWNSTMIAMDSFKNARMDQKGMLDFVSIILFNQTAFQLVAHQPLSLDFMGPLKSRSPSGGTLYTPAWQEVDRVAQLSRTDARLIVVFLTDGEAGDVSPASQIAAELHKKRQGKMNTFLVNIDKAVPNARLEPLVKAGNGGVLAVDISGERTPLLMNVNTMDLVPHFLRLAEMVNMRELSLKARAKRVRQLEQEEHVRYLESIRLHEEEAELRLKGIQKSGAELEEDNEASSRKIQELLKSQIAELGSEIDEVDTKYDNETSRNRTLHEEAGKEKTRLQQMERSFEDSKIAREKQMEQLHKLYELNADRLNGVVVTKQAMQQQSGNSDFSVSRRRLQELEDMKKVLKANCLQSRDQIMAINSLHGFVQFFSQQIRQPLGSNNIELASKADFVFSRLLKERALTVQGPPGSSEGLRAFLAFEARGLGAEDSEVQKALKFVFGSGISAEDLCANCKAKPQGDAAEQMKLKVLQDHLYEQKGIGKNSKPVQKLKGLEEKKAEKEKEYEDLKKLYEAKLQESGEAESACADDQWIAIDKIQKNRDARAEEFYALSDEVTELKCEIEEKKAEVREENGLCLQLLRVCMDHAQSTYKKQMARLAMQNLMSVFHGYYQNVHMPTKELLAVVAASKEAQGQLTYGGC